MSSKKNKNVKPEKKQSRSSNSFTELFQDGKFLLNPWSTTPYEWIGMGYALLMFTVFTLFFSKTLYTDMNHVKWLEYVIMFAIFAGCLVMLAVMQALQGKIHFDKEKLIKSFSVPQLCILGYLLVCLISAIASQYGSDVWVGQGRYEGFFATMIYVMIFVLLSHFGKYHKAVIYSLAVASIIYSIIAFGQYLGMNPLNLFPDGYSYRNTQFLSTMGNIDVVSAYFALVVPTFFAAYVLFDGKYRFYFLLPAFVMVLMTEIIGDADSGKVGGLAALAVLVLVLFNNNKNRRRVLELIFAACLTLFVYKVFPVTMVEGSVKIGLAFGGLAKISLVLAFAVAIVWLYYFFKDYKFSASASPALLKVQTAVNKLNFSPKQYRITIAAVYGVAVVGVVVFIYARYYGAPGMLGELSQLFHGHLNDTFGSHRGWVWKETLKLIPQWPWLGTGPDTFKAAFAENSARFQQLFDINWYYDCAHNDYLQIASNTGIPSLLLYIAFLVTLAVRSVKNMSKNPLILLFAGSVLAYSIHAFFSFSVPIISPLFWVAAGLLDKLIKQTDPNGKNLLDGESQTAA
jgi:O-antigen ligase